MSVPMGPTIRPAHSFDDDVTAESLEKAMRGGDKARVVHLLVNICNAQRQMLRTPYKVRYGKDLEDELKKALSGDLEDVVEAVIPVFLMQTPTRADVSELHRAVKGLGTNEKVLIELLITRTNEEIQAIRNVYAANYQKPLEDAIAADTSGDFKRLILILVQATRDETAHIDFYRASQDAQNLMKSLEKNSGIDKFDAFKILVTGNRGYVQQVATEYSKLANVTLEKTVAKEFSGDTKNLLIALLELASGKTSFFAKQIHNATKGLGTRDRDLIRILVSRSEIDLAMIIAEYESIFKKTVPQLITEECKGVYRDALLSIAKGNKGF